MDKPNVGIVGLGLYLPKNKMTAAEISAATGGNWCEDAVVNKLVPPKKAALIELNMKALQLGKDY